MDRPDESVVSRDAALAALDCGTTPLVLIGRRGRIAHANSAAAALLAAARTFGDTGGRLRVQRQSDQDAIEAAVAAAIDHGTRGTVHLLNRQGDITNMVTVTPLPGQAVAVACLGDLRGPILPHRHWSREALALPLAYAELAEALAAGENLAEFAERTGLTIGGARTRLKKLLKRFGTRSQSDLVSLLLRAAATLTLR